MEAGFRKLGLKPLSRGGDTPGSLRYRITLQNVRKYEAVIFREFDEPELPNDTTVTERKLISIANAHSAILDEMKGNPYFIVVRIEEAPKDSSERQY